MAKSNEKTKGRGLAMAKVIGRAVERTGHNMFRFMPGRVAEDNRILFEGIRYSNKAMPDDELGFRAGVGLGPGQHMPAETKGQGFQLNAGGVIVPARPNAKYEPVDVRDFDFRDAGGNKQRRQYVDWGTFQKIGDQLFVTAFDGTDEIYVEVWTGDFENVPRETTYQFIQAGMFHHGSVAYVGGELVVNSHALRSASPSDTIEPGPDADPLGSKAELMNELYGDFIGGSPRWIMRHWRMRYSRDQSEMILVRQLGQFFLGFVKNRAFEFAPVPARKYERVFEEYTVEQELVPVESSTEAAAA